MTLSKDSPDVLKASMILFVDAIRREVHLRLCDNFCDFQSHNMVRGASKASCLFQKCSFFMTLPNFYKVERFLFSFLGQCKVRLIAQASFEV